MSSLEGKLLELTAQHEQLERDFTSAVSSRDEAVSAHQELVARATAQSSTIDSLADQLERYYNRIITQSLASVLQLFQDTVDAE